MHRRTRRKAQDQVPKCSILGCSRRALVIMGLYGDGRIWNACHKDHAMVLIRYITQTQNPDGRGIWIRQAEGVKLWMTKGTTGETQS